MTNPSRIIILAEDQRQETFIRRYLRRMNYTHRQIRSVPLPAGRQSGEQWVRKNYAIEVSTYRQRSSRAETALVVAIDADTHDCNRRSQQLAASLDELAAPARTPQERICHLIPKRHVETWILCLAGNTVNEETDYRHHPVDQQIPSSALRFFELSRPNAQIPSECVASLRTAIPEIRRIE